MKKKILALFMAVSVFMTSGSVALAAEEINTEEVPACGTEETTDWEYISCTRNSDQKQYIRITDYHGSATDVSIPDYINDLPVMELEDGLFNHNTTIEKISIPKTVENIIASWGIFENMPSLKEIYVDPENPVFFSRDGVMFRYKALSNGLPTILKYPSAKTADTYVIPDDIRYVFTEAFGECSIDRLIIPESISSVSLCSFARLSDMTIILKQTNPTQMGLVANGCTFSTLNNCRITVKNEEMRSAVKAAFKNDCPTTEILLESELTGAERANYLTPATDLTFSDGSEVKNVTLMPDGKCTHAPQEGSTRLRESWMDVDYIISPTDTTDTVTWTSTNPDVADVYVYNGRTVLVGISEGNCTITGTTESGKQITLNVTVQTPASKTEIKYNGINNPETTIMMQDDDTFSSSIYFRVYPYNATYRENVTWKSSNPEVLDVKKYTETVIDKTCYSHKAALTLKKPGTATITATMQDGSNTITRSVTITVTGNDDTGTDSNQNNDSNTENNHDTNTGNNTDSNSGNNSSTNGNSDSGNTTVKPATKASQKITNVSSSYKKAYKTSFTLKPKAKTTCTYKSSNSKIATVSSKGKVTIKGTGKVTITITAKETSKYKKATKKVTIYAVPAKMKTPTVKAGSKKLTVSWKKDSRADGYQIQYSTSSKFKNAKTVTCSKKTVKKTIKKLKSGKKYYVRIRAYKKIGSKKYYGSYSKGKSVKVMKAEIS